MESQSNSSRRKVLVVQGANGDSAPLRTADLVKNDAASHSMESGSVSKNTNSHDHHKNKNHCTDSSSNEENTKKKRRVSELYHIFGDPEARMGKTNNNNNNNTNHDDHQVHQLQQELQRAQHYLDKVTNQCLLLQGTMDALELEHAERIQWLRNHHESHCQQLEQEVKVSQDHECALRAQLVQLRSELNAWKIKVDFTAL